MNNFNTLNFNSRQAVLPMLIQDYLDICDPVLTFDRLMGGIDLEKYLKNIPSNVANGSSDISLASSSIALRCCSREG
jgi:hypothetical protein